MTLTFDAMKQRYHAASAPRLHRHTPAQPWCQWVAPSVPCAKTSGAGSVRRHSHAGACVSRHMGYMAGLAQHATPTPQVGSRPPQPLGEGTPLAPDDQVGLYQCALGGCAPGYAVAVAAYVNVNAYGWGPSFGLGTTAVASACRICQDRVPSSCPDFGSAPRARAITEHR